MARSSEEISRTIRARLKVLDPDISAEPITVERKLIDTVSETIAEAEIDQFVLNYQYDIDTKIGDDLDRFVALFGFGRMRGRRAIGEVTFSRNTSAERDFIIQAGTQVVKPATSVSPALVYVTTTSVTLFTGSTEVTAPIESLEAGENTNVPANTITSLGVAGALGISVVTNTAATTGGSNPETDAELRIRFKNMIFRNIAGTKDQFLALAIASRYSKKANVVGATSRFSEYIQIPSVSAFTATSNNTYAKYVYAFDFYLTNGDPASEVFYSPNGDFSLSTATPPVLTANIVNSTLINTYSFPLPQGTLTTTITNVATTLAITVDASTPAFPTSLPFYIGIANNTGTAYELIRVDSGTPAAYTVTRGLGGTTGAAHNAGLSIVQAIEVDTDPPFGNGGSLIIGTGVSASHGTFLAKSLAAISTNYFLMGVQGLVGTFSGGTQIAQGTLSPGGTYLLEHSYTSSASRNDPTNNILNYVDVFVSGQDIRDVEESMRFPGTGNNANNTGGSPYLRTNYQRDNGASPTLGNRLVFPMWQPLFDIPAVLVIAGNTYTRDTHYWLITDVTSYHGSRRARNGIEFDTTAAGTIGVNTEFVLDYSFDRLPVALNELMDTYKQSATDVLVHGAKEKFFRVNLTIMYTPGFAPVSVDAAVENALLNFLEAQSFGAVIQLSDLTTVAANIAGVDAVRITRTTDDATYYGVEELTSNGTHVSYNTNDFRLKDDELPILDGIKTTRKAQNTWQF